MDNYEYQVQNPSANNSNDIFDLNGYNQALGTNVYKSDFKSIDNNSTIISHSSPFSKNDDLKSMLESNKDGLKLEAMKKLITMVAKGRTSSGKYIQCLIVLSMCFNNLINIFNKPILILDSLSLSRRIG